ncbi:DUF805 domain-containing protein [Galactobacter caseinivorans]|uniref:DUF805 domain-containing protein n=1 Tax=Galactobacter caseinivorans TaxID=2676123 RepID=A0A496PI23_9MICC|nr:DUF805 domain-containing protein [Galactobacter caseinivorans]RKW70125.1 DUF805 domain-containing protein [Galactobacter caseinivorans]
MSNQPGGGYGPQDSGHPQGNPGQPQYGQPSYGEPQRGQSQPAYQPPGAYASGNPGANAGYGFTPPLGAASPDDLNLPLYGASFGQAARRFFKSYARFTGRASRSEYWWASLMLALIYLIPTVLFTISMIAMFTSIPFEKTTSTTSTSSYTRLDATGPPDAGALTFFVIACILCAVVWLALLIPSIALTWRRLHDGNFAGPWYFITFTSVGSIVLLVFMFLPPKAEGMRFDVPGAAERGKPFAIA